MANLGLLHLQCRSISDRRSLRRMRYGRPRTQGIGCNFARPRCLDQVRRWPWRESARMTSNCNCFRVREHPAATKNFEISVWRIWRRLLEFLKSASEQRLQDLLGGIRRLFDCSMKCCLRETKIPPVNVDEIGDLRPFRREGMLCSSNGNRLSVCRIWRRLP